jgi:hypothetical protein
VFHVELRQFPHVAREFNLSPEALQARIVAPWVAGQIIELGERKWAPERARLTIYEGPELRTDELGMGRGWSNATRSGTDVTARVLAQTQGDASNVGDLAELKLRLLEACRGGAVEVRESVRLAGALRPGARASERLALAEQAVWEMLHTGDLRLLEDGAAVGRDQWQLLLLSWGTWAEIGADHARISIAAS